MKQILHTAPLPLTVVVNRERFTDLADVQLVVPVDRPGVAHKPDDQNCFRQSYRSGKSLVRRRTHPRI